MFAEQTTLEDAGETLSALLDLNEGVKGPAKQFAVPMSTIPKRAADREIAALRMVAESGNQMSIKDAYAKADSQDNRPGERGGHLSRAHAKSKFPKFGQILLDNQLGGRASAPPPRKRGW